MSKKTASWIAAASSLFITLLLGAVLLRPALAIPEKRVDDSTPAMTITETDGHVENEYEIDDDDEHHDDQHDEDDEEEHAEHDD